MDEDWLTALLARTLRKGEPVPVPRPRPFSDLPDAPPEVPPPRPIAPPSPPTEYGSPRHQALRDYGLENLKQRMWESLGVDYVDRNSRAMRPGYYNDSQTPWDVQRGVEQRGQPNVNVLKELELMMEGNMQSGGEAAPNDPDLYKFYGLGGALQPQRKGKV